MTIFFDIPAALLYDSCFESIMQSFRASFAGEGGATGTLRASSREEGRRLPRRCSRCFWLSWSLRRSIFSPLVFSRRLQQSLLSDYRWITVPVDALCDGRCFCARAAGFGVCSVPFSRPRPACAFLARQCRDGSRVDRGHDGYFFGLGHVWQKSLGGNAVRRAGRGCDPDRGDGKSIRLCVPYPGADGKFGRLVPEMISPATGNPLGLDENDPGGQGRHRHVRR